MLKSPNFFIEFLKLTKLFWCSSRKARIRGTVLLFAMLTVMQMVMAVLMTQWSAGLFNALELHSMRGFLNQVGLLLLLFIADMTLTGSHLEVKRNLQMLWRTWLTDFVFSRWMENGRHYLIAHMPGEHDNPDGRIAEDCRVATESAVVLLHTLFYSFLLLVGFTKVLWTKSGVVTLNLGFAEIQVYGHLIWVAILYTALASWVGWKVSQPLTGATNIRQSAEAKFRASLLEAQENTQAIALIHAEPCERRQFRLLFCKIRKVWDEQTRAWRNIVMFGTGYSVLSMAFPILVVAPRYILGRITLGDLMQSAQAFQHMTGALSWPVNNLGGIAEWRASVERVLGLLKTLDNVDNEVAKADHWIQVQCSDRPVLAFRDLSIAKYEGQVLVEGINTEIHEGDRVLITGNPYNGAKLFRAIAGIRPWGSGIIELPAKGRLFFMPPRPHLPTGTLQEAIWYPALRRKFTREQIEEAMRLVGLEHLVSQLDKEENWLQTLTRGEQQRLGVARLLINRPQWIFVQEAFDSLKPEDEEQMLQLIREQLPNAAWLIISHSLEKSDFYTSRLSL
ncbi:ABC transporter ATP-binding protein/permease [Desulfobulbus propionicus]|jgi:putative ATP-binding cassette transporter